MATISLIMLHCNVLTNALAGIIVRALLSELGVVNSTITSVRRIAPSHTHWHHSSPLAVDSERVIANIQTKLLTITHHYWQEEYGIIDDAMKPF
jgi:hypothetical protein